MQVELSNVTTKTLPSAVSLSYAASCPTRDLVALSPPTPPVASTSALPDPPPPAVPKLALWRTTDPAESVWEWTPRPPPSANPAPPPPVTAVSRFAALRGKAKEAAPTGKIRALAWNPQGSFLAVAVSSTSATDSSAPSSFSLLSVHTGTASLPSILVPTPGHVTFLAWQPLHRVSDPTLSSFSRKLVLELPTLPALEDKDAKAAGAAAASGAAGGMFQAHNAALMREREKEAGRPLELIHSAKEFPTLLPRSPDVNGAEKEDQYGTGSLLIVGDDHGLLHLYLAGSVLLGSINLEPGYTVVGASLLSPRPDTPATTTRLSVLLSSSSASNIPQLSTSTLAFAVPPSLEVFVHHSTQLRLSISHAFEALQEARSLWDESRRVSKAWVARLADLVTSHGETNPPITLLLLLLVQGRASKAVHALLASKPNERVLAKLESSTASALEKLRQVTYMSIAPAIEQVILFLEELKSWAAWREKFAPFQLEVDWIENALEVSKEILKSSAILERLVVEEEKCFGAFSTWVRYELDKLSQQEGSDIRPNARFQPISVTHYLRHCLLESRISPYLAFGSRQVPLESNAESRQAEAWYEGLREVEERRARQAEHTDDVFDESLEIVMRRMKEELKGQEAATLLGKREQNETTEWQHPGQSSSLFRKMRDPPTSLPILLHLLASKVGAALDAAIKLVGEGVERESTAILGPLPSDEGRILVREREIAGEDGVASLYSAWIASSTLWIHHHESSENASAELQSSDREPIEVVDFGFLDDIEMVFVIKITSPSALRYELAFIQIASLEFSQNDGMATPMSSLPISRMHLLDNHFSPEGLALNGNPGRRVACILAGEGRRLEVLDVDNDEVRLDADISMN